MIRPVQGNQIATGLVVCPHRQLRPPGSPFGLCSAWCSLRNSTNTLPETSTHIQCYTYSAYYKKQYRQVIYLVFYTCPSKTHGSENGTYSPSRLYIPKATASPSSSSFLCLSESLKRRSAMLSNSFSKCLVTWKTHTHIDYCSIFILKVMLHTIIS